jgi:5'-methylthioadenosine phosphorylase
MQAKPILGVIGGSGLYVMDGLAQEEIHDLDTPFGKPSSPLFVGEGGGKRVVFLARHGIGHVYTPSEVNYRANIYAMKMLGVDRIVAVSACGSLREDYAPGDVVVPEQLFDRTENRPRSFFEEGIVAHITPADPFCSHLSQALAKSVEAAGGCVHRGGIYITIPGPRFSTRAESNTYRGWGMSIIGMTTCPEAFLAREAEMCYAVMAHVTDYDVWHIAEEPVTVERIIQTLQANTKLAQAAIYILIDELDSSRTCDCSSALKDTLLTDPEKLTSEVKRRLGILVERYLP